MISTHPGAKAFEHALLHLSGALQFGADWSGQVVTGQAFLRAYQDVPPDQVLNRPGSDQPYLHRWHVTPRGEGPAIYLHRFLGDDPDPRCHTHPFASISFILEGSYREIVRMRRHDGTFGTETGITRYAGDIVYRNTEDAHRVVLFNDQPVTTLFITGFRTAPWGFVDVGGNGIQYYREGEE